MRKFLLHLSIIGSTVLSFSASWAGYGDRKLDIAIEIAEWHLESDQPEAAWSKIADYEEALAGDPKFDAVLGRAALATGRYGVAMLALERAVAVEPNNAEARLDLARAYRLSGDARAAKRELQALAQQNPPTAAKAAIQSELNAISAISQTDKPAPYSMDISAGGGYDSNANGAPDLAGFAGFTLNERSTETASWFYDIGVAVASKHRFGSSSRWSALVSADHRGNPSAPFADTTSFQGGITVERGERHRLIAGGLVNYALLDNRFNRRGGQLSAAWQARFARQWLSDLRVLAGVQRFNDRLARRDVNQGLLAATLARRTASDARNMLGATLIGGTEHAIDDRSPWGRELFGLRLFGSVGLGAQTILQASVEALESDYRNDDVGFLGADGLRTKRDDRRYAGLIRLSVQDWPAVHWSFVNEFTALHNESSENLALYEYDSLEYRIGFVRRFQ